MTPAGILSLLLFPLWALADATRRARAALWSLLAGPPPVLCAGCGCPLGEHTREEVRACREAVVKGWGVERRETPSPFGPCPVCHGRGPGGCVNCDPRQADAAVAEHFGEPDGDALPDGRERCSCGDALDESGECPRALDEANARAEAALRSLAETPVADPAALDAEEAALFPRVSPCPGCVAGLAPGDPSHVCPIVHTWHVGGLTCRVEARRGGGAWGWDLVIRHPAGKVGVLPVSYFDEHEIADLCRELDGRRGVGA